MKPNKYIELYKLNTSVADVSGFIHHLGNEFKNRLESEIDNCNANGWGFTYQKFNHLVKETRDKFNSVSNKRVGPEYPPALFGKVFATYMAPLRQQYFPEEHQAALEFKAKQREKAKLEATKAAAMTRGSSKPKKALH